MYRQIDIFDFIEKPSEEPCTQTLFERIFEKINNPVSRCANCLCQYCTHNAEELYHTVKLEEAAEEPCFNCDECREYSGEPQHRICRKEECENFILSEYGANRVRKSWKVIE